MAPAGQRAVRTAPRPGHVAGQSGTAGDGAVAGAQRRRPRPSASRLRPHHPPAARDHRVRQRSDAAVAPPAPQSLLQAVPAARPEREEQTEDEDVGR